MYVSNLIRMVVAVKRDSAASSKRGFLKGVDEAWEQYKLGKGKRIISDNELDLFLDRL